jgi:hypothetical protein
MKKHWGWGGGRGGYFISHSSPLLRKNQWKIELDTNMSILLCIKKTKKIPLDFSNPLMARKIWASGSRIIYECKRRVGR